MKRLAKEKLMKVFEYLAGVSADFEVKRYWDVCCITITYLPQDGVGGLLELLNKKRIEYKIKDGGLWIVINF